MFVLRPHHSLFQLLHAIARFFFLIDFSWTVIGKLHSGLQGFMGKDTVSEKDVGLKLRDKVIGETFLL